MTEGLDNTADLDKTLSMAEQASVRDQEISRIIGCNEEDYFAIMDIMPHDLLQNDSVLKKMFRKKSLLIHPDKSDNKEAPKAFDLLRKANDTLAIDLTNSDDNDIHSSSNKQRLLDIYRHVESSNAKDIKTIRKQVSDILFEESRIDDLEVKAKQKREAKQREEEDKRREDMKLKRETAANWEDQRESRVANWRAFVNKVDKKKKKKPTKKKVLA